jgi:hypothetical protein
MGSLGRSAGISFKGESCCSTTSAARGRGVRARHPGQGCSWQAHRLGVALRRGAGGALVQTRRSDAAAAGRPDLFVLIKCCPVRLLLACCRRSLSAQRGGVGVVDAIGAWMAMHRLSGRALPPADDRRWRRFRPAVLSSLCVLGLRARPPSTVLRGVTEQVEGQRVATTPDAAKMHRTGSTATW